MHKEDSELLRNVRRMMSIAEAFKKAGNPLGFETWQLEIIRDFGEAAGVWAEMNKAFVDRVIGVRVNAPSGGGVGGGEPKT